MPSFKISHLVLSAGVTLAVALASPSSRAESIPSDSNQNSTQAICKPSSKTSEAELAHLTKLTQTTPNYPGVYYQWGQYHTCKADISKAVDAYTQAITLDPKFAHAHLALGQLYEEQQQWNKAITAYRTVIELDPKLGEAYPRLATLYTQQNQPEAVDAILQKALPIVMTQSFDARYSDLGYLDAQPYLKQGKQLLSQGKLLQAEPFLRKAVSLNPSNADAAFALSELLVQKNDPDAAINVVEQTYRYVLKRMSQDSGEPFSATLTPFLSHSLMANHFIAKGDLETAIYVLKAVQPSLNKELQNLATQKETDLTSLKVQSIAILKSQLPLQVGSLLAQQGKEAEAVEQFRTAIKTSVSPFLTTADLFSFMIDVAAGNPPKEKSQDPADINSQAYKYLGDSYFKNNAYPQAIAAYQTAIQSNPSNQAALSALGQTQLKQNQIQQALKTYQKVAALQRQSANKSTSSVEETAVHLAAGHLLQLRQFDQATQLLQSTSLDQLSQDSRLLRQQLLTRAWILQENYPQAESVLQEILAEDPPNSIYLYSELAKLQIKQKKLAEAEQTAKKMIEQSPSSPLGYSQLSHVYSLQNKPDLALASFYPKVSKPQPTLSNEALKQRKINAQFQLANILKSEGELELALAQFSQLRDPAKAIQNQHIYQSALYNMAEIYLTQGQSNAALPLLKEIIAFKGEQKQSFFHSPAQALLAKIYTQQGTYDQAIAAYRESQGGNIIAAFFPGLQANTSEDVLTYSSLGQELSNSKRTELALQSLDLAVQLQPDATAPRQLRGKIHEDQGNIAQASQDYQIALEGIPDALKNTSGLSLTFLDPKLSNLYTSYGRVLLQQDNLTQARLQLEQAILANPANSEAQSLLETITSVEKPTPAASKDP